MTDVSSWFIDQLNAAASEPKRVFTLSGSDHSIRVLKWPLIRRDATSVKPAKMSITLTNVDGTYNGFYSDLHTIPATCSLDLGFTHPTSGDELVRVYTGRVEKVNYADKKIKIQMRDKVNELAQKKVGDTENPVTFSSETPSDIVWTLCSCYGGLSNVASTSNPDIDYASFDSWTEVFSIDSVVANARYEGEKVTEALSDLCEYTESFMWVNGTGKIVFDRFEESSVDDFLVEEGKYKKTQIDVDLSLMVNRQHVGFNYSVTSDYWQSYQAQENTSSINSYGLREHTIEHDTIWYVNTVAALSIAARRLLRYDTPYRSFNIGLPLFGLHREPGNNVRVVNSFFSVDSSDGWLITKQQIDMHKLLVEIKTGKAIALDPFYLDVDHLDGDETLL